MSWTRLDDTWTDLPELSALDHQVRWHYLAMIQFCSRTKRFDGILRLADARRCSDIDEPAAAISTLVESQLLIHLPNNLIKVGRIEDHIPPPSVRENSARSKIRMQRHRKHKNGDHSECLSENCEQAKEKPAVDTQTGEVTAPVTRNTRTGQDRTGQAGTTKHHDLPILSVTTRILLLSVTGRFSKQIQLVKIQLVGRRIRSRGSRIWIGRRRDVRA